MDWGPPVLPSAITSVDADGPNYRGVPALTLAERDAAFEAVCALLWQDDAPWPAPPEPALPSPEHPIRRLQRALLDLPPHQPARALYTALVAALSAPTEGSLAERIAAATGVSDPVSVAAALTVCADHELNPSTFAARVAASTGAATADALLAGLATLSGGLHGGLSDLTTAWLHDRRPLPGPAIGHALYPAGDPRADHLIERALQAAPPSRLPVLRVKLAEARTIGHPNLDVGLAALAYALGGGAHAAITWFAIARIAGYLAHIDEQRRAGGPVRPRARYVGP